MTSMRAMVWGGPGGSLKLQELPLPSPEAGQVLLEVHACGVCRTDLHIVDGELTQPVLPLVLGHQAVGSVLEVGPGASLSPGLRVGVPWLGRTCGACRHCATGRENLCSGALFTGFQLPGGYATHMFADAAACIPIPDAIDDLHAAPLLCAGLIGYRALSMCGDAQRIGLYGFGSSAHIVLQVLRHQGRAAYAFTRPGDLPAQALAQRLGATWAGGSDEEAGARLEAAIIFAPLGALVPVALAALEPGGTVVCAGIHMSDIPAFPYRDLWMERSIRSVANLTRRDGEEFMPLALAAGVHTEVTVFELEQANDALSHLRRGEIAGSAVLRCGA
jgi:propanol-preferring alcohol dehydrogenase